MLSREPNSYTIAAYTIKARLQQNSANTLKLQCLRREVTSLVAPPSGGAASLRGRVSVLSLLRRHMSSLHAETPSFDFKRGNASEAVSCQRGIKTPKQKAHSGGENNGKQTEHKLRGGRPKCGGLRYLPGRDSAQEDVKVLALVLLGVRRLAVQSETRLPDL